MIRTFLQESTKIYNELLQIDTESGNVKIYSVDKSLGFPFSEYETTVKEMGYKSIKEIIKRMQATKKEIDTATQTEKEINGILNLAKYRAEHNKHIYIICNDGKKYNDIIERLKAYGISEEKAAKMIENKIA